MLKKSNFLFVYLIFLCLLGSACRNETVSTPSTPSGSKLEPRTAGTRGGTLSYRLTAPPKTFNYLLAADEASLVTAFFLMSSRLIEFDHREQKYGPALAETWKTAEDGITVDIKLRENLRFSDGQPLTADDVIFTLGGLYDERTNSPAFRDAMLVGGKKIAAKKISDLQLQLIFPEKVAAVENYLDNLAILPKHKLEGDFKAGKLAESWKITAQPQTIATSGPFTIESSSPGERLTLKRNEHYFKKDANGIQLPYLDKMVLEIISDANNAIARLNQGSLDIADRIRSSDFAALSGQAGAVRAHDIGPGLGTDHIWFNLNKTTGEGNPLANGIKYSWFNNKTFRQAVSAAIDRNSISSLTLQGLATPLYGFVAPANRIWANQDLPKIEYDLEKARRLLAEAGFKQQGNPDAPELFDAQNNRVEFTLIVPAENEPRKLMAAVIQEDLAKLGIKMQVVPVESQALSPRWSKTFDYDAILFGLAVTGTEPTGYANFLLSKGSVHQWHINQKTPATDWEARVDTLFAEQARESDVQKRTAIFNEIQSIIADESPVIPIAARHIVAAANARVGNYAPSSILPYSVWNAEELFIKQ
ncbi:MAG: ABC transporter substrate-binding protein [Saprospiraceae bacterium]|nr:ABC transporter substrate-binding protein [Pyrinomonadaceae bacterium]